MTSLSIEHVSCKLRELASNINRLAAKDKSILLFTIVSVSKLRMVVGALVIVGDVVGAIFGGHASCVHTLHGIFDGV